MTSRSWTRYTTLVVLSILAESSFVHATEASARPTAAVLRDVQMVCQRIDATPRRAPRKPVLDQRDRDFALLVKLCDELRTTHAAHGSTIDQLRAAAIRHDITQTRATCRLLTRAPSH